MTRGFSILIAITLLAACGSDNLATSDSADAPDADTASVDSSEPAASAADDSGQPDDTDTESGTGTEPNADSDTGPETDTGPDADSGSDTDTDVGDDPEPGDGTDPGDDTEPVTVTDPGDDTEPVTVTDIDDIPAECRQIMSDFLRQIEPIIADIDWNTATVADLQGFEQSLTEPIDGLDQELVRSGCDEYDFGPGGEQGLELSLELAKQDAPGVVGYLEFVSDLTAAFDPQNANADLPTDCDEAIAYVRQLVEQTEGLSKIPAIDYGNVTAVVTTVQFECPAAQATAFFEDPTVAAWAEN